MDMPSDTLDICEATKLPEILARFPRARAVLNRYGLNGGGGVNGPVESISFFSRAQGVDEAVLVDELRKAVAKTEHNYNRPAVIASSHKVAQILAWFPESEAVFARNGFLEINNPVLRRTVARRASVAQAGRMHGIALNRLLIELNVVATNAPNHAQRAGCRGCEC
jgi:hypothetical protein